VATWHHDFLSALPHFFLLSSPLPLSLSLPNLLRSATRIIAPNPPPTQDCAAGFRCPGQGNAAPQVCPSGTYAQAPRSLQCTNCPGGHSCADPAQAPVSRAILVVVAPAALAGRLCLAAMLTWYPLFVLRPLVTRAFLLWRPKLTPPCAHGRRTPAPAAPMPARDLLAAPPAPLGQGTLLGTLSSLPPLLSQHTCAMHARANNKTHIRGSIRRNVAATRAVTVSTAPALIRPPRALPDFFYLTWQLSATIVDTRPLRDRHVRSGRGIGL